MRETGGGDPRAEKRQLADSKLLARMDPPLREGGMGTTFKKALVGGH